MSEGRFRRKLRQLVDATEDVANTTRIGFLLGMAIELLERHNMLDPERELITLLEERRKQRPITIVDREQGPIEGQMQK